MYSWRDTTTRAERMARAQQSMIPGTAKGRVVQASPTHQAPRTDQDPDDLGLVWVDDNEPAEGEAPQGKLWFKTNEPV